MLILSRMMMQIIHLLLEKFSRTGSQLELNKYLSQSLFKVLKINLLSRQSNSLLRDERISVCLCDESLMD